MKSNELYIPGVGKIPRIIIHERYIRIAHIIFANLHYLRKTLASMKPHHLNSRVEHKRNVKFIVTFVSVSNLRWQFTFSTYRLRTFPRIQIAAIASTAAVCPSNQSFLRNSKITFNEWTSYLLRSRVIYTYKTDCFENEYFINQWAVPHNESTLVENNVEFRYSYHWELPLRIPSPPTTRIFSSPMSTYNVSAWSGSGPKEMIRQGVEKLRIGRVHFIFARCRQRVNEWEYVCTGSSRRKGRNPL